jgi:hypothetical protein
LRRWPQTGVGRTAGRMHGAAGSSPASARPGTVVGETLNGHWGGEAQGLGVLSLIEPVSILTDDEWTIVRELVRTEAGLMVVTKNITVLDHAIDEE